MQRRVFVFLLFLLFSLTFISAGELKVTQEHPFLINGNWISAKDLHVGDNLTTLDGKKIVIDSVEVVKPENPFLVYNLEVSKYHTFLVGDSKVVVHNAVPLGGGAYTCAMPLERSMSNLLKDNFEVRSLSLEEIVNTGSQNLRQDRVDKLLSLGRTPAESGLLEKIVSSFRSSRISTADFQDAMKYSIETPGGVASMIGSEKYVVITGAQEVHKSYFWAWKVAEKPLVAAVGRRPIGQMILSSGLSSGISYADKLMVAEFYLKSGAKKFILFDDISYSAQQAPERITEISHLFVELARRDPTLRLSEVEIILDFPYMSRSAEKILLDRIERIRRGCGLKFTISSGGYIKDTVYNPAVHSSPTAFDEFWLTRDELTMARDIFSREGDYFWEGQTFTWTDWKIADGASLSGSLADESSQFCLLEHGYSDLSTTPNADTPFYKRPGPFYDAEDLMNENYLKFVKVLRANYLRIKFTGPPQTL
ncbi:hypothetical protein KA107_01760 [Candidatus Pacearchaeota archaeon]|nr:hypothetical protein [Candidatus Pacearchaeota archaeon]